MILISACLLGINCRYDGSNCRNEKIVKMLKNHVLIPVCPEILGGMETPRKPCEAKTTEGKKRVYNNEGIDFTGKFLKGAEETLKIAKMMGIRKAILKENSPSCGVCFVYDGNFSGKLTEGKGITAEKLEKNGIKLYSEHTFIEEQS